MIASRLVNNAVQGCFSRNQYRRDNPGAYLELPNNNDGDDVDEAPTKSEVGMFRDRRNMLIEHFVFAKNIRGLQLNK